MFIRDTSGPDPLIIAQRAHDHDHRTHEFLAGVRAELPILLGVAPFGMIYGALAIGAGLPRSAAQAMSSIVFAGSLQFVATQTLRHRHARAGAAADDVRRQSAPHALQRVFGALHAQAPGTLEMAPCLPADG